MAATDYIFISMLFTSAMLGSIFLIAWCTIISFRRSIRRMVCCIAPKLPAATV